MTAKILPKEEKRNRLLKALMITKEPGGISCIFKINLLPAAFFKKNLKIVLN
jgi:hypothetical protein